MVLSMSEGRTHITDWEPPTDILPTVEQASQANIVLPTSRDQQDRWMFDDELVTLPKMAQRDGARVEFAKLGEEPQFLTQHDMGPEILMVALALAGPINDWIIFGVQYALDHKIKQRGYDQHSENAPQIELDIAFLKVGRTKVKGLKIKGFKEDVIDTLRSLEDL